MSELAFTHEAQSPFASWDHEDHYEIIDGERQEIAPMGVYENYLASRMQGAIDPFVEKQALGRAVIETLFLIQREPREFQYRPDFAFVSFERWPADRRVPRQNAWDVVPDLVAEVISPTNRAHEVTARLARYFSAGVRRAWVVYPNEALVYVYESPTKVQILTREDDLDGGDVLPEFKLPLKELFESEE